MKQILRKSHKKLTELLDKANKEKEDRDTLSSFAAIDTIQKTNEESMKNFANIDEQRDSNVVIPKVEDGSILSA